MMLSASNAKLTDCRILLVCLQSTGDLDGAGLISKGWTAYPGKEFVHLHKSSQGSAAKDGLSPAQAFLLFYNNAPAPSQFLKQVSKLAFPA